MDQKKRDKIAWVLAFVLIPVLIYLFSVNVFNVGKKRPAQVAPVRSEEIAVTALPFDAPVVAGQYKKLNQDILAAQRKIASGAPSRNPFVASSFRMTEPAVVQQRDFNYRLTAVILGPGAGKRMAMIDGKMYEEGERIGKWTVLKVNSDNVVFDDGVNRRVVSVK